MEYSLYVEICQCMNIINSILLHWVISSPPYTVPPEWCQTIIDATERHPQCESLGNCSGIWCRVRESNVINGRVSAYVTDKCAETLSVQVLFTSDDSGETESLLFSGLGTQTILLRSSNLAVIATLEFDAIPDILYFEVGLCDNARVQIDLQLKAIIMHYTV